MVLEKHLHRPKPSYHQGFARHRGESDSPQQWDGLVGAWMSSLGPSGDILRNISGRGNHGVLDNFVSSTAWVIDGERGYTLSFDGTDDAVEVNFYPEIRLNGVNFTLSAWVKTSQTDEGLVMVRDSGSPFESWYFGLNRDDNNGYLSIYSGNAWHEVTGLSINDGAWHHIAVVYVPTTFTFYVDAELVGTSGSVAIDFSNVAPMFIGGRDPDGALGARRFEGNIDDVRIYNVDKTPHEIEDIYFDPWGLVRLSEPSVFNPVAATTSQVVNETEEITDAQLAFRAMNRFAAETLEMAEAIIGQLAITRIINESVDINEAVARILALVRLPGDQVDIAEAVVTVLQAGVDITQIVNENVELSDFARVHLPSQITTPTLLTNDNSATNADSYATASVSPSDDALVLVAVGNKRGAGSPTTPTISGGGMSSWTQVETLAEGNDHRITVFRALEASPGTGTITIDFGGVTQDSCIWAVVEWTNANPFGLNGAGAILQTATATGTTVNNLTVNMSSFGNPFNNAVFAVFGDELGSGAFTPGDGFVELSDQQAGAEAHRMQTQWKCGEDLTVDVSKQLFADIGGIAIEIMALPRSLRIIPDDLEISEVVAAILGIDRSLAETIEIAEASEFIIGKIQEPSDTVEISEAIITAIGRIREVQDTIEVNEAILASRALTRLVNETIQITESVIAPRALVRPLSETLEIADQVVKNVAFIRSVADTITIVDGQVSFLPLSVAAIIDLTMPNRSLDLQMPNRSLDLTMRTV